jgi:metal-responsive CopG/Arc/MetJ family transcriptional regulator
MTAQKMKVTEVLVITQYKNKNKKKMAYGVIAVMYSKLYTVNKHCLNKLQIEDKHLVLVE